MYVQRVNMIESATIPVVKYRDDKGRPTCARNFNTGEVCQFYRTQRFGLNDTCLFSDMSGRYWRTMDRYDNSFGYLIPLDNCPLWKDEINQEG